MSEGTSLRSRVPGKWQARFWSRGGWSDLSIDCNYTPFLFATVPLLWMVVRRHTNAPQSQAQPL